MKNFVLRGISSKKNFSKNSILNSHSKFNFCVKSELIENEIMKSFSSITKKYKINETKKEHVYSFVATDSITMDYMKNKYSDSKSDKDIDKIINVIFREEVLNLNKEKEYENLIQFIKNCKKYNYPEYLTDVKYYKNKEIRNLMTNTNLLETLHQQNSPFSLNKEFEMKIQVQNLYKLRKGQKGEKIDSITNKEFELDNYQYLNFLAETSTFDKLNKAKKINKHNEKILQEFKKGDNMVDTDQDVGIRDSVWKNHYIEYLKKMKKGERKESLGLSKLEEPYFNDSIEKSADRIYKETSQSQKRTNSKEDFVKYTTRVEESKQGSNTTNTNTNRFEGIHVTNYAHYMNDGVSEPFPFYGKDDYPIEEFFDESTNVPDKDLLFAPLQSEGKISPIPPKVADWLDRFFIDAHLWSIFTQVVHHRLWVNNVNVRIFETLTSIKKLDVFCQVNSTIFTAFNLEVPPSLIDYYNLLPKWAREHPTMKMVVRGLEYHQPWTSYREKIMAVNWTLQVLMEKDRTYTELINMSHEAFKEDITMENLPSLLEHDEEETRNVLQDPNDEATDDEEMEIVSTAEEVRAIEKEEEEERKKKKKEEGRAKRAAEEAKDKTAEGKADKAAEDKKKKEDAEKKKKESAEAVPEEEEIEEEEKDSKQDNIKTEDKELEDRMFSPTKRHKSKEDKEDEILTIYDSIYEKGKGDNKEIEEENTVKELDDMAYRKAYGLNQLAKDEETLSYSDEMENFRRASREQKNLIESKKEKLITMLRDLKNSNNIKTFEEKVKIIKRNLEEVSSKTPKNEDDEVQVTIDITNTNKQIQSDDLMLYPLSLLNSSEFDTTQKDIIRKQFSKHISNISDAVRNANVIVLDVKKDSKSVESLEEDIMSKISTFETENKETGEGFDMDSDYKDSLKDEDKNVDVSEELGLQDAFYKQIPEMDYRKRTEDPIPFEYFLNEDGFWDSYIAFHRSKIHVKQFMHKPFNPYMKNIKRNENI